MDSLRYNIIFTAKNLVGKDESYFANDGVISGNWCAWFISRIAGLNRATCIPTSNSCTDMINKFKKLGTYHDYKYGQNKLNPGPSPGAIIFYVWNPTDGPDHVGIVESVSGETLTVIEGNKTNISTGKSEVGRRVVHYKNMQGVSDKNTKYNPCYADCVYGFAYPNYEKDTGLYGPAIPSANNSGEFVDSSTVANNAPSEPFYDGLLQEEDFGHEEDLERYLANYINLFIGNDNTKAQNAFYTEKEMLKFKEMNNLRGIIGLPPQFMATADTRLAFATDYDSGEIDDNVVLNEQYLGTDYAGSITTKMPLVYFTPCEPVFLPVLSNSKKKTVIGQVIKKLAGNMATDLESMVGNYSGKIYSTKYAYADYFKYVNPMCRIMAKYLGLQDGDDRNPYKEAAQTLKTYTYNWGRNYMDMSEEEDASMKEILSKFESSPDSDNILGRILYHRSAIPFYANAEPSVQEEFSNETSQSNLASGINSWSDQARELQFILGLTTSQVGINFDKLKSNLDSSRESLDNFVKALPVGGNVFSTLVNSLNTVVTGGKLMFPEIWNDSSFARTYNINMKLISPSPDNLSIWRHILVPLAHIYGLVCPRQADKYGYSAPFLVKVFCKGMFHIDMGIITSVNITKGKENTWNKDGLPTYVDVSISVKDLYSNMAITSMTNMFQKYDTMNNMAEMDFLANACGVNFSIPDTQRYIEMFMNMHVNNTIRDAFGNLGNDLTNWGLNKYNNVLLKFSGIRGSN